LIVRTLDEITDTGADIKTENWRSKRIILAKDGVGFSVHETTLYAGTASEFWYANHVEAVFITSGEGEIEDLTPQSTRGILPMGGTILGTSRTNPFKKPGGPEMVVRNLNALNVGAVVAIGGEDTLGVATKLHQMGVNVVGVPKTIDNDLSATDFTFGFNTAVQIATDAIDRLHTTAESHDRVMVVEVMGRHAGWIATYSGIAGGADVILVPEDPFDIGEVCDRIVHRHRRGANFSIVVVAEGALPVEGTMAIQSAEVDEFGHVRLGGISNDLASAIEGRTGDRLKNLK